MKLKSSLQKEENILKPIAIIGIGCRFPGGINTPESLWEFVKEGKVAISEVPDKRWNIKKFFSSNENMPGKMYVKKGGFLKEDIEEFDAMFFGISPREAGCLDPQQRILLEVAWEAFEDAGIVASDLAGSDVGVYIGGFTLDGMLNQMNAINRKYAGPHTAVSSTMTILSNRISYFFDFKGPSVSMDTACSSSLVSFHYACQAIWNDECSMALAGGASIMFRPEYSIAMCKGKFLSPDGYSKSFDDRANGYARGEGAGIIVLKPLSKAIEDNNRIYAVVRATGVNQDGKTNSITVPNPESQETIIKKVIKKAGIQPGQICYVEAHGTGTATGDPIEAHSIGHAIGMKREKSNPCLIGSIKANIGHLEASSGVAGIIKAALCLHNMQIPPIANLQKPNSKIPFDELGLKLPLKLQRIPEGDGKTFVGINSFGYGGTNAHAILEQAPVKYKKTKKNNYGEGELYILPLSAKDENALIDLARSYLRLLEQDGTIHIRDLCYSAGLHRTHHNYRLTFLATDKQDLIKKLKAFIERDKDADYIKNKVIEKSALQPVFVFSGMGPQWWKMGRELFQKESVFREAVKKCDELFKAISGWSILEELLKDEASSRIQETQIAQPANFVIQVGLLALYKSWGIVPSAVVGHSVGEVTTSYASGAISLEEALLVSYHRSRVQKKAAGKGTMLATGLTEADALAIIEPDKEKVSIAAINSPSSVTLSGNKPELEQIAEKLNVKGIFNRFLKVEVPYHSYFMEPLKEDLSHSLASIEPKRNTIPVYSTVTGGRVEKDAFDASYWFKNIREPVYFAKAINTILDDGYGLFLEVGPHPVLSSYIKECLAQRRMSAHVLSSLNRKKPEQETIYTTACHLYSIGYDFGWRRFFNGEYNLVKLPTYPWQREKYWYESEESIMDRLGSPAHPLLGNRLDSPLPTWEGALNNQFLPFLSDHVVQDLVVLPGASYVEMGIELCRQIFGRTECVLQDIQFNKALVIPEDRELVIRTCFDASSNEFKIFSQSSNGKNEWDLHVQGKICNLYVVTNNAINLERIKQKCREEVDPKKVYNELEARGLKYGLYFQSIKKLWRGEDGLLAFIEASQDLNILNEGYNLHPALLDSCFQSLISALSDSGSSTTYLPVRINQINFLSKPQEAFYSFGRLTNRDNSGIEGDIYLMDREGNIFAEVHGIYCKAIDKENEKGFLVNSLYDYEWEGQELEAEYNSKGKWIVFSYDTGLSNDLVEGLKNKSGCEIIIVKYSNAFQKESSGSYFIQKNSIKDLERVFTEVDLNTCKGILYLCNSDKSAQKEDELGIDRSLSLLFLFQKIFKINPDNKPRIYVLTQGAHSIDKTDEQINIGQATVVGLSRVAFNEYPEYKCTLIDTGPDTDDFSLKQIQNELLSNNEENDIAFRNGKRFVHRLKRKNLNEVEAQCKVDNQVILSEEDSFGIEIGKDKNITLRQKQRVRPAKNEIEVRLNNVKIQKINSDNSDRNKDNDFFEITGTIVNAGDKIRGLKKGETIYGIIPGPLSSYLTFSPEDKLIAKLPDSWQEEEFLSSAMPIITSAYCLNEVTSIQANDVVLVRKGDEGTTQALIQYIKAEGAKLIGASEGEMDDEFFQGLGVEHTVHIQSSNFMQKVLNLTSNKGVDVFIDFSSSQIYNNIMDSIADYGRYILIKTGGKNIKQQTVILSEEKNLLCYSIDMHKFIKTRSDIVKKHLRKCIEHLNKKGTTTFNIQGIPGYNSLEDFQKALKASPDNGFIMRLGDLKNPKVLPDLLNNSVFHPDSSYLITGGFGGFGRELAKWMSGNGAKHLVLAGRKGASSDSAQKLLKELESNGTKVLPVAVDITVKEDVEKMIKTIDLKMPKLKGIIHAAAVLEDGLIVDQNEDTFRKVLDPKVIGAWNLSLATIDKDLDFFLLFSSISSLIGNARQSNYVAGNAFLDAFAYYRRMQGLPATSINWGALGTGGMTEDEKVTLHLKGMGLDIIKSNEALEAIKCLIEWKPIQIGVMKVDWKKWKDYDPVVASSPRFSYLVPQNDGLPNSEAGESIISRLRDIDPEEWDEILAMIIVELIAESLRIPVEKIGITEPLTNLGVDSLLSIELKTAIEMTFGVEISTLELMKGINALQLAKSILLKLGLDKNSENKSGETDKPEENVSIDLSPFIAESNIDELSEEELNNLLVKIM
ncbi:MAG: SDR family NAD(P)-dependent oxidoreductase [bacterium]